MEDCLPPNVRFRRTIWDNYNVRDNRTRFVRAEIVVIASSVTLQCHGDKCIHLFTQNTEKGSGFSGFLNTLNSNGASRADFLIGTKEIIDRPIITESLYTS